VIVEKPTARERREQKIYSSKLVLEFDKRRKGKKKKG
jgi:hypothetical protein